MKTTITILTGEVAAQNSGEILKSNGIGSCVVVALYDAVQSIGGLAHIMLPGVAPHNASVPLRYAENALSQLLDNMGLLGADQSSLTACLVGGGNVLQRKDDKICTDNLASVEGILASAHIPIFAKAVGGTVRRSILLDTENGNVYFTEGDSHAMLLGRTVTNPSNKGD